MKDTLAPGELVAVPDFSENHTFTVQESAPAYYYNNSQATVFSMVIYFRKNEKLEHFSYVGVSESLNHNSTAVYMFQDRLITYLKQKFDFIDKIHYFSDGAPQQFKNKKAFINLVHHSADFGIEARWNFFPTAHGKGPCDGLGGQVKRLAKRFSLQGGLILSPKDLYEWADQYIEADFVYCSNIDYDNCEEFLKDRFAKALSIKGTLTFHCMIPTEINNIILCKRYSSSVESENRKIFK